MTKEIKETLEATTKLTFAELEARSSGNYKLLEEIKEIGGAYFPVSSNSDMISSENKRIRFASKVNFVFVKFTDVKFENGTLKAIVKNPETGNHDIWMIAKTPFGFIYEDLLKSNVDIWNSKENNLSGILNDGVRVYNEIFK